MKTTEKINEILKYLKSHSGAAETDRKFKKFMHCIKTKRKVKSCLYCLHGPKEFADCKLYKEIIEYYEKI